MYKKSLLYQSIIPLSDRILEKEPSSRVRRILLGEICPSFDEACRLLSLSYENPKDVLMEISERDAFIKFTYFYDLYESDQIAYVLKDIINDRGLSVKNIASQYGTSVSYMYSILSANNTLSFEMFSRLCDIINVTMEDVFSKAQARTDMVKARGKLADYIKSCRIHANLSLEEVSCQCRVSPGKLQRIENNQDHISIRCLRCLHNILHLDAAIVYPLALQGRVALNKEQLWFLDKKNTNTHTQTTGDLCELLFGICKYRYIYATDDLIETHTVVTLVFLFLLSYLQEHNLQDINHYLQHLDEPGNISLDLVILTDSNNKSVMELFMSYKQIAQMSFYELAAWSNYSLSEIQQHVLNDGFWSLQMIDILFNLVGLPCCVGIEYMIEKNLSQTPDGEISLNEVSRMLSSKDGWNFYGQVFSSDYLNSLFCGILDESITDNSSLRLYISDSLNLT